MVITWATMIARLVHESLRSRPERVALSDAQTTWTAAELDRVARSWAARLAGTRRVGLAADNGLELVGALLGALYAGAAVVPFHAGTPREDLEARMERFSVEVLVSDRALAIARPVISLDEASRSTAAADAGPPARPRDQGAALLLQTSGTTGEPRAVVITQACLGSHAQALARTIGLHAGDRVLAALPLAHSYGCRVALLVPLLSGAEVVLAPRFSARATLALVGARGITWAPLVPTMLSAWCAAPGEARGSLRWVLSAGAPLPDALRRQAEAKLGCAVREGYGLTEASFSTLDAPPLPPVSGSVGRPVPGVDLRLDPETHEVQVRGVNVMGGYLDDPEGTQRAFTPDGWLRTGDVGAIDDGGNLRIVARIKDIILSGGHTIYPAEVESVLMKHPLVRAAAVVGRPDPHLGEVVVAHVVLEGGLEASSDEGVLTEWSRTQLAPYKAPRAFVRHAQLPLGPSGKVLKRQLRVAG